MAEGILQLKGIAKDFSDGKVLRRVLKKMDINLYPGELTIVAGPSGSGWMQNPWLTVLSKYRCGIKANCFTHGQQRSEQAKDNGSEGMVNRYHIRHVAR